MTPAVTTAQATESIADALRRNWGTMRHGEKSLAALIGTNVRTARNWLLGENLPDATRLIELMKRDDAVFRAVMELAERPVPLPLTTAQRQAIRTALDFMEGCDERDSVGRADPMGGGVD